MREEKALLRSVMRVLHPDLFSAFPVEQEMNGTAMKSLNHYLDEIARDAKPEPVLLEFWVKCHDSLKKVKAQLGSDGLLAPLYYALDLISRDEYEQWTFEAPERRMDEDLLDWLQSFVGKVVEDGEHYAVLRSRLAHMKADIESHHQLKNLHLCSDFGAGFADLKFQLDLLGILDAGLRQVAAENHRFFAGLRISVHQPKGTPFDPLWKTHSRANAADGRTAWIADDGHLHVVVEQESIVAALKSLDLDRAGLLTRLHAFWERRAAEMRTSMKHLFQVQDILCDVSTGSNAQHFVLWAGCILANREEIGKRLAGRSLPLTLLVHSDDSAPMVDYSMASMTLHSDRCLNAGDEAQEALTDEVEEQRILEEAREALGAKQVIRICSVYERQHVIKAAERLIEHAESIRQTVDLSDAGIAIDSDYQAWESGFVSIPYDYRMADLRPNLKKLIGQGRAKAQGNGASRGAPRGSKAHTPTMGCLRPAVVHPRRRFPRPSLIRKVVGLGPSVRLPLRGLT